MAPQSQLGLCAKRNTGIGSDHRVDSGIARADLNIADCRLPIANCQIVRGAWLTSRGVLE